MDKNKKTTNVKKGVEDMMEDKHEAVMAAVAGGGLPGQNLNCTGFSQPSNELL